MRETFGDSAVALPVLTGTGANVTTLQTMLPRWSAVIAAQLVALPTDDLRIRIAARREVRWMCSFETAPEGVDAIVADIGRVCGG